MNIFLILITSLLVLSAIVISIIRVIPEQFIYDNYLLIILVIALLIIIIIIYHNRSRFKKKFKKIIQILSNFFKNVDFKRPNFSIYRKIFNQEYKNLKQLQKLSCFPKNINLILSEEGMKDYISTTYPTPLPQKNISDEKATNFFKFYFYKDSILIDFKPDSDNNIKDFVYYFKLFVKKKYVKSVSLSILISIEVNFTEKNESIAQDYIKRLLNFLSMLKLKQNKEKKISIFLLVTVKNSSNEIFDALSDYQKNMPLGVLNSENKKPDVFLEYAMYLLEKDLSNFRLYCIYKNIINSDILEFSRGFYGLKDKIKKIVADIFKDTCLNGIFFTFKV